VTLAPDISVSVVSLGHVDLARQCLASIDAQTRTITYETHLVALDCQPRSLEDLQRDHPNLVLHSVSGVRGYSENMNVALRVARGRYVAILNDDTILHDDVFGKLVHFLDKHPEVAGACPVFLNPDGSLQIGLRGRFTPLALLAQQLKVDRLLPLTWAVHLGAFDRPWLPRGDGSPVDIEAGTGACFVARRDALQAIGFLDEAFFLAPDDIDWTLRLRRRVGRVVTLPDVSITHLGGTTLASRYHAVLPTVYAGYYTFFRRYYGRSWEWLIRLVLGLSWSAVLAVGWSVIWTVSRSPRAATLMRARANCARFALSQAPSATIFARLIGR
jgi:GT2 family glycosyltransferase